MHLPDQQLLHEIMRGAQLAFENAEKLFNEAHLLGGNGAFARALTLHQISMEECSKVDMLGAAATSLILGHSVDVNKLVTAFRKHKVKNFNNAYFSRTTNAEREAAKSGDAARAGQIFKAQQASIHEWLNTSKNASLYVDYLGDKFISPSDRITEELAAQFEALNAFFLGQAANHLAVLRRLVNDPDAVATQATDLLGRLERLKRAGGDLDEKFREIVDDWLDEQTGKST